MKKKQPNSTFETRMDGARDLAKKIVRLFYLDSTDLAARFSVVSFSETATLRETWSTDREVLAQQSDSISPDGKTSISAGLTLAGQLLDNARDNATKVVLLTDGEQTVGFGWDSLLRRKSGSLHGCGHRRGGGPQREGL